MNSLPVNSIIPLPTEDIIPDDQELDEGCLVRLMKSIETEGLINAITIRPNKKIIAGRHRLEAFKRLNIKKIPCVISSNNDPEVLRIHENTLRAELPLKRKLADAEYLIKKHGPYSGTPLKDIDCVDDTTSPELDSLSDAIGKIVVDNGLFSSRSLYFQAKKIGKECLDEVIDKIDAKALSIGFVYEYIVRKGIKKDKQTSFLYKLGDESAAGIDKKLLNKEVHRRRAERRKKRFRIPTGPGADPVYNIIRVAPDWWKEKQDDIEALPITDYCIPTAVIAVECPIEFVGAAIKALETWGFTYRSILTAFQPGVDRAGTDHHAFSQSRSWHICIGTMDPKVDGAHTNKICPALQTKDPQAALSSILADLWPDKADKRLDMSSTDPRKGWMIWKLDYATKEK